MKTMPKPTYKELEKQNLKLTQTVMELRGDQEKYRAILGLARDITARKQAEEALLQTRNELESRIKARTAELTAANRQLELEIPNPKYRLPAGLKCKVTFHSK